MSKQPALLLFLLFLFYTTHFNFLPRRPPCPASLPVSPFHRLTSHRQQLSVPVLICLPCFVPSRARARLPLTLSLRNRENLAAPTTVYAVLRTVVLVAVHSPVFGVCGRLSYVYVFCFYFCFFLFLFLFLLLFPFPSSVSAVVCVCFFLSFSKVYMLVIYPPGEFVFPTITYFSIAGDGIPSCHAHCSSRAPYVQKLRGRCAVVCRLPIRAWIWPEWQGPMKLVEHGACTECSYYYTEHKII